MNRPTLSVAVIGAGPAGYYTAEALTKTPADKGGGDRPCDVRVDIIDRLPTPYGLIRAGVAPDHQSIKGVSRRFQNVNEQSDVRFVGNLALGRDITLAELRQLYDAVVLATGAPKDRPLDIEGEGLDGVIGSGAFVGWYNAHPDFADLEPDLNVPGVAVIGNGNVAVDVARVLAKTAAEMAGSDLADHAARHIHTSAIRDIYVLGRRGPVQASFTPKELGELNRLENCVALVDGKQLPDAAGDGDLTGLPRKTMPILRAMADNTRHDKPVRLHLMFYRRPMAVLGDGKAGDGRVKGVRLEETHLEETPTGCLRAVGTGRTETLKVGLIVPCIGYRTSPIEDVPYDENRGCFTNRQGVIDAGLYCVGWARRGPTGTIGTNKPDGMDVAAKILAGIAPGGKPGRSGLNAIAEARQLDLVTFRDWRRIEAAEENAAKGAHPNPRPRAKLTDVAEMIRVAKDA